MISNLHRIKEVSISDVITRYAKIERGNFACCPIHNEKSPSLKLYTKTNTFKCFGCGASGDAIALVQKVEGWDFIRSLELVASIGGIEVEISEEERTSWLAKKENQRNLQETLSWSLTQYRLYLEQSTEAKEYLISRHINEESIAKFQLGFAPDSWSYLTDMIVGQQTPEHATALGIIREKEKGGFYDFFRNRIIFPYLSHEDGSPLSLSGRTITANDPNQAKTIKGLNITGFYANDSYLFGLYQAYESIKTHHNAIIVEGEIDTIMMHQAGATNTIAKGNNRLKEPQCQLLKRLGITDLLFMPDHDDKNGKNPGFEGFEDDLRLALQFGFRIDVFELPKGQDPDDFAKEFYINNLQNF